MILRIDEKRGRTLRDVLRPHRVVDRACRCRSSIPQHSAGASARACATIASSAACRMRNLGTARCPISLTLQRVAPPVRRRETSRSADRRPADRGADPAAPQSAHRAPARFRRRWWRRCPSRCRPGSTRAASCRPGPGRRAPSPSWPTASPTTCMSALAVSCGRWLRNASSRSCASTPMMRGSAPSARTNAISFSSAGARRRRRSASAARDGRGTDRSARAPVRLSPLRRAGGRRRT